METDAHSDVAHASGRTALLIVENSILSWSSGSSSRYSSPYTRSRTATVAYPGFSRPCCSCARVIHTCLTGPWRASLSGARKATTSPYGRPKALSEPRRPTGNPGSSTSLTTLSQQKNRLRQRIDRERLILGDLPELSVQILDIARDRGRVSVADAVQVTGASRNTIKGHMQALVAAGHLGRHGAGRGTWYSLA